MATGLLIRDFFKEYRELRYTDSGSIRLSEIEHNAYRNALTLEITHIDAPRYENLKTLPNNSHYGYATSFKGSTVSDSISIKYPKFRVFDIKNNGIWNYHELTESKQLQSTEVAESVSYGTDVVGLVFDWVLDSVGEAWEFLFGGSPGGSGESYRAFPVASPFPDVVKFKSDVPVSFLFRLESWYLVNPVVYVTDNPTDSGDETEGEDEYPTPSDDPFPPESPSDPGSDPRDYNGGESPGVGEPGGPQYEGGQCPVNYRIKPRWRIVNGDDPAFTSEGGTFVLLGPLSDVYGVESDPLCGGGGGQAINDGNGTRHLLGCKGAVDEFSFDGWVIMERVDGGLDNCGNPPPVG